VEDKLSFSKIKHGQNEEIFETIVTDGTGRELEKWRCNKKDYFKVIKILNNKFGLNLIIKNKSERDLDWLNY